MAQQWPPLYRLQGGVHGPGSFCFTVAPAGSGGDTDTAPPAEPTEGPKMDFSIATNSMYVALLEDF